MRFWSSLSSGAAAVFLLLCFLQIPCGYSEDEQKPFIKSGVIVDICDEGSYIVVNDVAFLCNKKFLETSGLKLGDHVDVVAKETKEGLVIIAMQLDSPRKIYGQEKKEEPSEGGR